MAPRSEPSDLPPGPEADASAASPAVQRAEGRDRAERAAEGHAGRDAKTPDRVVTMNNSLKPKEEEPTVATVQTAPSEESVAAEATAAPSHRGRAGSGAHGRAGAGHRRERAARAHDLAEGTSRASRPAQALSGRPRQPRAAEIVVSFVLDRTGHVLSSSVVRGSGDAVVRRGGARDAASAPIRCPPRRRSSPTRGSSFTLPVIFRVKGKGWSLPLIPAKAGNPACEELGPRLSPGRAEQDYRTAACTDAAVCPNRIARSSAVRMPPGFGLISFALA